MSQQIPERRLGDFSIHMMRDEEAPGVVALYHHVYGEMYPIKDMYNPGYIIDQQKQGFAYRVVVTDAGGEVIAHQGLFRLPAVYKGLYEDGHGMVNSRFRGQGLSSATFSYLEEVMAPALGIEEQWGEAVCNHLKSQKCVLETGGRETGIELDLMPADPYEKEKSSNGRVSSVVGSQAYIEKPHTVYLPLQYEDMLRQIYSGAGRERSLELAEDSLPAGLKSDTDITFFQGAGVLRVSVTASGADLTEHLQQIWDEYIPRGAVVLQAVISLEHPWSGAAARVLNSQQFFFAALLPRWFDADGMMMQRILHEPNYAGMLIYSDFARTMVEYVRQDRERVTAMAR